MTKEEADRHLALYQETNDGLLVWRASIEYRHAGLPVPEVILRKLDQFADGLTRARSADDVARALEMKQDKGGAAGVTRTRASERQRDIVRHVAILIKAWEKSEAGPMKATEAFKRAAAKFGTTPRR